LRAEATHNPQRDGSRSVGVENHGRIEKLDNTVACYAAFS
jgi:hypothetical protein